MAFECSILITTYNAMKTICSSIQSVLNQIDEDFEVIVVDNYSSDGTLEYLQKLADEGLIKLIVQKCNRGEGRQIALEQAEGEYVIARVDMDSVHYPIFKDLLELYIENERRIGRPFVLNAGVLISRKDFLLKVGGWRPLQWGENYELYKRLIDKDCLYLCRVNESSLHIKEKFGILKRIHVSYISYRDSLRMGVKFIVILKELKAKTKKLGFIIRVLILIWAWITHWFYSRYDTFKNITWKEFFQDGLYWDELNRFEEYHPDKVIDPPEDLQPFSEMKTVKVR